MIWLWYEGMGSHVPKLEAIGHFFCRILGILCIIVRGLGSDTFYFLLDLISVAVDGTIALHTIIFCLVISCGVDRSLL